MLDILMDSFTDALLDAAKLLPFLFAAFLLLEGVEHNTKGWMTRMMSGGRKTGPLWGAALGLIPQCGFSVMGSNMYAGGMITLGTLLSIYLSTSDEAVIILLGNPDSLGSILPLLCCKLVIGIAAGFGIDAVVRHEHSEDVHEPHELCENCGCDKYPGIVRPALYHTAKLFGFIFLFNFILNIIIEEIGMDAAGRILLSGSVLQPLLTAAVGLIPNCAASIFITEMYLGGIISFGSAVAGLCAGAGVGLAVLFKMHRCTKKNIGIAAILYGISVLSGLLLNLL